MTIQNSTGVHEKFKAIARQAVLSERWMVWFEGLSIDETEDQSTCLAGEIPDYPALYGLLERIRDLNLHLVSVQVQTISQKGSKK